MTGAGKGDKRIAVLDLLRVAQQPSSTAAVCAGLAERGQDVSERSVRQYLAELHEEGLVEPVGRRRYRLTADGRLELKASTVLDRARQIQVKIDQMAYRMDFQPGSRRGRVIVDASIAPRETLVALVPLIRDVFSKGYALGEWMALLGPGERLGDVAVPDGWVGLCTVSGFTVNGLLLRTGVPIRPCFGGLLELAQGQPTRFVERINYGGSTVDPAEVFAQSGLADHVGAVLTGNGRIGVGFGEVPADSAAVVAEVAGSLARVGLQAVVEVGQAGQSLFGVPVSVGSVGLVTMSGLNPASVFAEMGCRVESCTAAGLLAFHQLFHYSEVHERLGCMAQGEC